MLNVSNIRELSFTYTANGKLRISQNRNEQIKTAQGRFSWIKKLREATNLGVEVMNSKREVKKKHGHVVQFAFAV